VRKNPSPGTLISAFALHRSTSTATTLGWRRHLIEAPADRVRHAHEAVSSRSEACLNLCGFRWQKGVAMVRQWKAFSMTDDRRRLDALVMTVKARKLNRRFVASHRNCKRTPVHARERAQAGGEQLLFGNPVQIGDVDEATGLFPMAAVSADAHVRLPETAMLHRQSR